MPASLMLKRPAAVEEEDKENSYLVTPAKSPRVSDEMVDPKLILLHREQDRRKSDQEMLQTAMNHIIEMNRKFTEKYL